MPKNKKTMLDQDFKSGAITASEYAEEFYLILEEIKKVVYNPDFPMRYQINEIDKIFKKKAEEMGLCSQRVLRDYRNMSVFKQCELIYAYNPISSIKVLDIVVSSDCNIAVAYTEKNSRSINHVFFKDLKDAVIFFKTHSDC